MSKLTAAERAESIAKLREWYPKGSTVYTVLRGTPARSGSSRVIGLLSIQTKRKEHLAGHPSADVEVVIRAPNYHAARLLGLKDLPGVDGVRISGGGMDMGFEIAYRLASVLYDDGYALQHRWL